MDYHIDATGGLVFTLDEAERAEWREMQTESERCYDIVDVFAESGLSGNCDLDTVRPEQIGALTDAPIFADGIEHDPDGTLGAVGNVWWFPDYQVLDPLEVLLEKGSVRFAPSPENTKSGQAA